MTFSISHCKHRIVTLLYAAIALLIFTFPADSVSMASSCATFKSIAYEKDNTSERLVATLDHAVTFKSAPLEKDKSRNLPWRLYVDFQDACLAKSVQKTIHPDSARIHKIRVGNRDKTKVRIVFDLESSITRPEYTIRLDPDRLVLTIDFPFQTLKHSQKTTQKDKKIQLEQTTVAVPLQTPPDNKQSSVQQSSETIPPAATVPTAANPPTPSGKHSQLESPPAQVRSSKIKSNHCVIVIDPGHGGKDPGAIGYNGIKEKDVCLSIARILKKVLDKQPWCKTILTRSTDKFVSLEQRAKTANTNNADFFISIHTNSHEDEKLTGIETYYLNFSSDADARRVAARENFTTPDAISDLEMILFDLLQSDKINKSSILAGYIHSALINKLKQRYTDIRNLGIKHAPMRVLIDAEMPCVIIEAAFISNPTEAMLLKKNEHQRLLALAIVEGIHNFKNGITSAAYGNSRKDL